MKTQYENNVNLQHKSRTHDKTQSCKQHRQHDKTINAKS